MHVRQYRPDDGPWVERQLERAGLPTADLAASAVDLFVGETAGDRVGVGGLEVYGDVALLRSLVVDPAARGSGYGTELTEALLDYARGEGVERVYLLTETAADFFGRLGFEEVPREAAPPAIRETTEFTSLCPASATCLRFEGL